MAAPRLVASTLRLATPRLFPTTCAAPLPRLPVRTFSTSLRMTSTDKKDGSSRWASGDGRFRRQTSTFRDEIKKGGTFEPELNRYILIVAYACPWAHRTLITRALKGIDKVDGLLPVYVVNSMLSVQGWTFESLKGLEPYDVPGTGLVPGHEDKWRIRDFYLTADPEYSLRCTVPVVWDNKLQTIVNNESSEIIRFLNTAFDDFLPEDKKGLTFFPQDLQKEIEEFHSWVYPNINNGVYKSGFATTQDAYEEAVVPLFEALDRAEKLFSDGREYVFGDRLTEADIRLYTTIVRFDPVYVTHFKCNLRTIREGYPHLHKWLRKLYWSNPAFKETTDFDSIKSHYFCSHVNINPNRIVPKGPVPNILPLDN